MSTEKKSMMDKILEKVDVIAGPMTKFGQIPFVRGIVNGMVAALPVTMVGSLFLVVYLFCSDGGLTTHALIPFLKPWAGDLALVNAYQWVLWLFTLLLHLVLNMQKSKDSVKQLVQLVRSSHLCY